MPDMPGQGAPQAGGAPQGAPQGQGDQPQGQGGGGGIAEAIVMVDETVFKIAQAVSQNDQLDDDVKSAWQDALAALRKAEQALTDAAGGKSGGDQEPDDGEGTTTPQQAGAKGAVPMTHAAMRGQ